MNLSYFGLYPGIFLNLKVSITFPFYVAELMLIKNIKWNFGCDIKFAEEIIFYYVN